MTRLEDLADLNLIDENTKLIITDDANKEIPSNMTMHVDTCISKKFGHQVAPLALVRSLATTRL